MDNHTKKGIIDRIVSQVEKLKKIMPLYKQVINDFSNTVKADDNLISHLASMGQKDSAYWRLQLDNAEKNTVSSDELISKLDNITNLFNTEKDVELFLPQYLLLVESELKSVPNIDKLESYLLQARAYLKNFNDPASNHANKRNTISNMVSILTSPENLTFVSIFLDKLVQLETFEHFKNEEHSFLLIGANGSGKSTFSRRTKQLFGNNLTILPAQKIFSLGKIQTIQLNVNPFQTVHNYQSKDKLDNNWGDQDHDRGNFQILMNALVTDHAHKAFDYYSPDNSASTKRESSILEKTVEVWNKIIFDRKMKIEGSDISIKIYPKNEKPYDFPSLSDGQKAVFYYTGNILTAKENSFIIVDEPENHLHVSIVSKVWDSLELLRPDCKFIYLTHNLDFAISRTQAKKLWSKSYTPSNKWDIVELPIDEDLPEALLMELLGSRKKILFCEGKKSSLDYKLYTLLFPDYILKPVGGHLNVINYTRAFNDSKELFGNTALGIIDGDFHSDEQKEKWENCSIYCIEAQEVENILCDEKLLKAGMEQFKSEQDSVEKAKREFFYELEKQKEAQSVEYVTQKINNMLKENFLGKQKTKEGLKNNFTDTIKEIDIEKMFNKRLSHFETIISKNNYSLGIKSFNSKGLVGIVGSAIVGNYKERIIRLLGSNNNLLNHLLDTYFPKTIKNEISSVCLPNK